jgi:hypothetical protein
MEGEGRRQRIFFEKEGKESSLYKDWSDLIPHEASSKALGWTRHPSLANMETSKERERERGREREREREPQRDIIEREREIQREREREKRE